MSQHKSIVGNEIFKVLEDFAKEANGLNICFQTNLTIEQKEDFKSISIDKSNLEEVLIRSDFDQKTFLQLNFVDGNKVLLTHQWIGFKPINSQLTIFENMPNVVTTPDLVSVFEALEESKRLGMLHEATTLKQVFEAIVDGGEAVGFDMSEERTWLKHLGISTSLSA